MGIGAAKQVTINLASPQRAARSAYLEQVKRIAPPELVGREAELAELAAFCLERDRRPYVWWRAEAWAGKSALMSTFVLRPPSEVHDRVRMVSFFITARLAAQDTREAFTEVLLEQLAELTGQDLPSALPEVIREAYLLDLLAHAAKACQDAGGRLVLVVDGLDEDRSVITRPDAHSIAGLLPADPPGGMRVIVAGRPNPPIPDDVPDWHPLRDPGIIRPLHDSPYARNLERLGRQELQRLLQGTPVEQDLLALLTAARGGLSGTDLEELTGAPLWEVEEILHTVAGRTFTRRTSQWAPETGPEVYLLGHEELQAAASRYLGHRLEGYHDKLHAWADGYRGRGWPPGTPEYLLRGYYRLLTGLGDLPHMITCAGDPTRHDRMLDMTGGDAAALAEVRTALDVIAAQDMPDLASALRLAYHRDQLTERNTNIPVSLPAIWATLGQVTRAEALATSFTDPGRQAQALVRVAGALAQAGEQQQAEALARSITDPGLQAHALAQVADALAQAGQQQQAEALARSITDPHALAQVAYALAQAGQQQQAEAVARSINIPAWQAQALAQVAEALTEAGQLQQAEAAARSITDPGPRAHALAQVAGALAQAGQQQQANAVAGQAEAAAHSITDPGPRAQALAQVAGALAQAGQQQQANAVAGQAEAAAHSITNPARRAMTLTRVAGALAQAGQQQQAEELARSITDPTWQAQALARVAAGLAQAGQQRQAEELARSITDPGPQAQALARVAGALAQAGQHQQAEVVARSITNPARQAHALAQVAEALAQAGQQQQAVTVAGQTEVAALSLTDPDSQARALVRVAEILAGAGDTRSACRVAAAVCVAGHWTTAAGPVLLLDPNAFATLTGVLDSR